MSYLNYEYEVAKRVRSTWRRRYHSAPAKAYLDLRKESKRTGLPKHYRHDLTVHDWEILSNHPDAPFIWVLRECGTHVILHDDTGEQQHRAIAKCIAEGFSEVKGWYIWNSAHGLVPVENETVAVEWLEMLETLGGGN